jgi:CDGSH-type Zn-finger protein
MDTEDNVSVTSPGERSVSVVTVQPRIEVTEHGPYRTVGEVAIYDTGGTLLRASGTWCLCRCGGSSNQPFCDVTHGVKGFDGAESADRRGRWVARMTAAADDVGLPSDPGFRSTFVAYLEWGTRLAVANSQPDATVIGHAPIPHWDGT